MFNIVLAEYISVMNNICPILINNQIPLEQCSTSFNKDRIHTVIHTHHALVAVSLDHHLHQLTSKKMIISPFSVSLQEHVGCHHQRLHHDQYMYLPLMSQV